MNRKFNFLSTFSFNWLLVIISAIALSAGGMVYIFFRPFEHVFFRWISTIGFESWLNQARNSSLPSRLLVPQWVVYSLPDGLWAFAYALLITVIWKGSNSRIKLFWMVSIPLLVLGYEILQLAGIIPGTFCIQDIAFGITGLTIGITVGTIIKQNYHEKINE
jgi:hypothetical protein